MERSYSYAVLQAVPDQRRGERVNIGLVVLGENGLDIQVAESRKVRALTGKSWDSFIEQFSQTLRSADDPLLSSDKRLERLKIVQSQLSLDKTGWFRTNGVDYDSVVKEIMGTLVVRPRERVVRDGPSVVSAISAELKSAAILAARDESIDSGKVVRGYHVGPGLEADFAQLNARLHVAAVLDLRADNPHVAQAALKAVVLDRAERIHGTARVHKIGVYACAPARRGEVSEHISILKQYSEDMLNWDDPTDREGLKRIFFDAFNSHHPTPIS
ncbi:MAG: DUF3037 domain-containing protein [Proteobacteria bacterium]|nr:DUF3037 domain-containing protein [Pseudomonadota bacterium]